ncbi:kelch 17 [Paramuricea clavata]|uniref:Kelch 17 n=1 Tax=Paramuricea clavata TaxID=317549 RepID=A0A7D9HD62_PARCT|nr:kelch 17 [Paramuricea clavata]
MAVPLVDDSICEFNDKNAFQDAFKTMLDFRREAIFSDVIICSDDNKEFNCHKLILASASPYFRAMFLADMKESQQPRIKIKGLDSSALEQLLEFCYTATVTITSENVQQLLIASGMLQFPKIQDSCMEFLLNNLHESNCIGIWKLAEVIQRNQKTLEKLETYIKTNFSFVAKHEEFLDLTAEQLLKFLKSDNLNISTENDLSTAIIRWVRLDPQERSAHLEDLMKHVRFSQITRRHLTDVILNEELILDNMFCRQLIFDAIRYHLVPETRNGSVSAVDGRQRERVTRFIYLLGGEECGSIVNNVECYDCSSGVWHELTPMIIPRKFVGSAILDDQLYAVGGINDQYGDLVTVEACNLSTNQWTSLASLQECKGSTAIAVLDGWLYAAGGSDNGVAIKTAERYDSLANTWLPVPNMNLPRSHFCLQPLGGKLYAIGGYCGTCAIPHVEYFDPLANTWTEIASMNKPRMNHGSANYADKVYVVGGANSYGVLNSVEVLDPEQNHWCFIRNRFNPRSGLSLGIVKTGQDNESCLWILGGHDHKNRDFSTALKLRVSDLSFQGEISLPRTCVFAGHASV